jgi:hypothetical protein
MPQATHHRGHELPTEDGHYELTDEGFKEIDLEEYAGRPVHRRGVKVFEVRDGNLFEVDDPTGHLARRRDVESLDRFTPPGTPITTAEQLLDAADGDVDRARRRALGQE